MNNKVRIHLEKDYKMGETDDRLFSSFAEHLGRCIYTGLYEPGHPSSDENGFRTDVIDLIKELNISHIRYPGGNFLSGYDWKDGIGPKEKRPRRLDLAWKSIESNQFGIDEFCKWSRAAGTKIIAGVNMGTGTPKDAAEMVEYCNHPGGTYWSDLRIMNGITEPMDIKLWCVGNEMDGPWQICHLDADEYGKKAREAAKMMKWVDDSIELVVCGSSNSEMPTFPEWDRVVLEYTYDQADYLSMHRYFENDGCELDFLASFKDMDNFINTLTATADYVKAVKRSHKTMYFAFDEWNVWYQKNQTEHDWEEAPILIEDRYSLLDALTLAGMGMSLVNHCDRVKIACLAQIVNVIAPIITEKGGRVLRQASFWPFKYLSMFGRGTVLLPAVKAPKAETKYGDAPLVYAAAVVNADAKLSVFLLNISDSEMLVDLDLRSFGTVSMTDHLVLDGKSLSDVNTFDDPYNVTMKSVCADADNGDGFTVHLQEHSWHVLRFSC